jgi:hypothetical protein
MSYRSRRSKRFKRMNQKKARRREAELDAILKAARRAKVRRPPEDHESA